MDIQTRGLSQKQQNDCRGALNGFIEKHQLGDWEVTIDAQETLPMGYSVKVGLTPSIESGLPQSPVNEFAEVDTSDDVPAVLDRLLEAAYQKSLPSLASLPAMKAGEQ